VSLTRGGLTGDIGRYAAAGDAGDVANKAAQGQIADLAATLPAGQRAAFTDFVSGSYTTAFHTVLWLLAAVCALGAPAIVWMLRDRTSTVDELAPVTP
jgi:hypothetical protein